MALFRWLRWLGLCTAAAWAIHRRLHTLRFPVAQLGLGQSATVFRQGKLAVKVFHAHQGLVELGRSEYNLLSKLSHPNIVRCIGCGMQGDRFAITFEFVAGGDLQQYVFSRGVPAVAMRTTVVAQVAAALRYLHTGELFHGDVKPENVLLDRDPERNGMVLAKLADFGFAGPKACCPQRGTEGYAAPEIKNHTATDGRPADIYGLGALLFAIKFGRLYEARVVGDADENDPEECAIEEMTKRAPADRPTAATVLFFFQNPV
uniref:Protein kinase domain-containing protein n=1 Tax=viral metagenome TaxID=1070528 RepID=A0A6C0KE64_9ZZZZ